MAENASVASSAAAAAEHGGSAAAEPAGTEERKPLTELISDETGAASLHADAAAARELGQATARECQSSLQILP